MERLEKWKGILRTEEQNDDERQQPLKGKTVPLGLGPPDGPGAGIN